MIKSEIISEGCNVYRTVNSMRKLKKINTTRYSGVRRNVFEGGVQQIQLRTEDRENGDWGGGP